MLLGGDTLLPGSNESHLTRETAPIQLYGCIVDHCHGRSKLCKFRFSDDGMTSEDNQFENRAKLKIHNVMRIMAKYRKAKCNTKI